MAEQAKTVATTTSRPAAASPPALKLVPAKDLFNRMQQIYETVARRAFEIFESNGGRLGQDLANWFKAESEVLHPVHIDVREAGADLIVRAEVPGFTAKQLEVALEPRRVTIAGKREASEEKAHEKTIYTERRSDQVMRMFDLPTAVDPEKATATLKDGVLELRIPKAALSKTVEIKAVQPGNDQEC